MDEPARSLPFLHAGRWAAALLGLCASAATADIALTDNLGVYGDVRAGYFHQHRADRDGDHFDEDSWQLRARAGLKWQIDERLSAAVRVAGRYDDEEANTGFSIEDHASTRDGLAFGESTVDEAYVRFQPSERGRITVGRFQTVFALADVSKKSLDRNDSVSMAITWTDGIWLEHDLGAGWRGHFIAEYNSDEGPSNVRQVPLGFTDEGSRWSAFASVENKEPWGPVVQRAIDVTVLPDGLHSYGLNSARTDNYYAVVARGAAKWPLMGGTSFLLGVEAGHAPNTPRQTTLGTGSSGDAGGNAWQVSFNLMEFLPGHSIGLIRARAEAGWLISPDIRPNADLTEVRYSWAPHKQHRLDIRLRQRRDDDRMFNIGRDRVDTDFYVRYTYLL